VTGDGVQDGVHVTVAGLTSEAVVAPVLGHPPENERTGRQLGQQPLRGPQTHTPSQSRGCTRVFSTSR
jgi:hypothetical protein